MWQQVKANAEVPPHFANAPCESFQWELQLCTVHVYMCRTLHSAKRTRMAWSPGHSLPLASFSLLDLEDTHFRYSQYCHHLKYKPCSVFCQTHLLRQPVHSVQVRNLNYSSAWSEVVFLTPIKISRTLKETGLNWRGPVRISLIWKLGGGRYLWSYTAEYSL